MELEILLGLVFVRIIGGGPSLAEMWGDFVEVARPYRLEEMEPVDEPWIDTWQCNWKVAVDNNLENYHVPIGHPGYHRLLDSDLIGKINAPWRRLQQERAAREAVDATGPSACIRSWRRRC